MRARIAVPLVTLAVGIPAADRGDPDRLAGPSDVDALTDMLVLRFS